jgi:hypothetical protein
MPKTGPFVILKSLLKGPFPLPPAFRIANSGFEFEIAV